MLVLVTGGAASGKSMHAERILCEAAAHSRLYLATMEPYGDSARQRIARHKRLREGKGFETLERSHGLDSLKLGKQYSGILLEDMGNLVANELFSPDGAKNEAYERIIEGIAHLRGNCGTLVIVTNEVFSDGLPYDPDTLHYIETLGRLNTTLASRSDAVYESVCGILVTLKGDKIR